MAQKPSLQPLSAEERSANHRRQVGLQIWLPLGSGIVIVLGIAVLAVLGVVYENTEVNRWGNISAVYLIIPTLIGNLIGLALLVLVIRGMSKLGKKLPGLLAKLQAIFAMLEARMHQVADKLAAPILAMNSKGHGLNSAARVALRRK